MAKSKKAKANITKKDIEKQPALVCKIKVLVGYENEKTFATITTTKEEVDYQFWYPGRTNKMIKEYKDIKDNYSWNDENKGE